ncbi:hypothetical protein G3578_06480 [Brevibacillus sp. SYP-B805]|uniref:hypothetical protein n=1 Tax=Brevibacillus sp. SYP-B805 TaxID=1578199 RepID=UPI0013E9DED5|nr:hypothetical protein [Brevibacillus sp. SYP-B805]NGQ94829.1 hypothetical protein [Brevibacillus sp. SYP-B805]
MYIYLFYPERFPQTTAKYGRFRRGKPTGQSVGRLPFQMLHRTLAAWKTTRTGEPETSVNARFASLVQPMVR